MKYWAVCCLLLLSSGCFTSLAKMRNDRIVARLQRERQMANERALEEHAPTITNPVEQTTYLEEGPPVRAGFGPFDARHRNSNRTDTVVTD